MGQASINPNNYPTLQTIMNLARVHLNDFQAGLTGTPGEGQITTNNNTQSPQTLPALNSAIRTLYRKLRNAGSATLIKGNIQVTCPAINSLLNPPNAQAQVYLSYNGFYDGVGISSTVVLPSDFLYPLELSEQQPNNTSLPFQPMIRPEGGLPSVQQGFYNMLYEWRGDAIYMPGTLAPIVIALRYLAIFPQFFSTTMDFTTTQVPVMDCEEYLAWQTAYIVACGLEGITAEDQSVINLKREADEALMDLKKAYVRSAQAITYRRPAYGDQNSNLGGSQ